MLTHPFIIGELALGSLARRADFLSLMVNLPKAQSATDDEVRVFIEVNVLAGSGIGYTDAHLLAAARLSGVPLWSRDKRLVAVADKLKLSFKTQ